MRARDRRPRRADVGGDTADARRQKYRERQKGERDDLRQTADELSTQVRELINAREGRNTTARTDLVLSKSFWKQVATHHRELRRRAETERKQLLALVNSQSAYIEDMGITLRECPHGTSALALVTASDNNGGSGGSLHDQLDDLKGLRLKSSVSALYTVYLEEVDNCSRVDQVFRDADIASLPIEVVHSSYKYRPNGDVEYFQHRNRLLQPFGFQETCRVMWDLAKLTHRRNDRQVYYGVSDPDNTIGVQFRIQKTLSGGLTVSIMKHVVVRRFIEDDRVVIV